MKPDLLAIGGGRVRPAAVPKKPGVSADYENASSVSRVQSSASGSNHLALGIMEKPKGV